jgi:hypothetical protein
MRVQRALCGVEAERDQNIVCDCFGVEASFVERVARIEWLDYVLKVEDRVSLLSFWLGSCCDRLIASIES